MISVSITGLSHSSKLDVGLKFGKDKVLGNCGLFFHKTIRAYLSLSEGCDSGKMSSSPFLSGDLLKLCLNSSFS